MYTFPSPNRAGLVAEGLLTADSGSLIHNDTIMLVSDGELTASGNIGGAFSCSMISDTIGTSTPPYGQIFNPEIIVLFDDSYGFANLVGEGVPVDGKNFELNWNSSAGFHYGPQSDTVSGPSGAEYTHTQASASAIWTVNHNLGFRPDVSITSLGGLLVDAEVTHVSANQLTVTFDVPFSGYVRCT